MKTFPASELPINADGSVFHLHLRPEHLAEKVILVGDPGRVEMVASFFDTVEHRVSNREFNTITGTYKGKRLSVLSTGIGCDNIEIVMVELDALANIDLATRTEKPGHQELTLVRIGTCGGVQPFTTVGSYVISGKSIGFDGLLNYYADRDEVCDLEMEAAFVEHMQWSPRKGAPYVAVADKELTDRIAGDDMIHGYTIACGGFFAPQGRRVRADIQDPQQNEKVQTFEYDGKRICNFEMESSALAGLSSLLGHKATTCCLVVAGRYHKEINTDYKKQMRNLVVTVLERI